MSDERAGGPVSTGSINQQLLLLAIQELPVVIELVRQVFAKHNPTEPLPTDADVIAAFNTAYASSIALDQQWLASHPEDAPRDA